MKKQYDTKRLTDELSRSVFFQDPEPPDTPTPEQHQVQETRPQAAVPSKQPNMLSTHQQPALATSQQSSLSTKQQADKAVRLQNEKAASNQANLAGKQQAVKATTQQVNKALKRFTSYLQGPTLKALRVLAAQQDKKDYEVLQEAVEQYLAREQANM